MNEESQWFYIHEYRRLVNKGYARPIACPDCDGKLVSRIRGDDVTLWLWCSSCDSWKKPGLDLLAQVKTVCNEHMPPQE